MINVSKSRIAGIVGLLGSMAGWSTPGVAQQATAAAGSWVRFATDADGKFQVTGQVLSISHDSIAIKRNNWSEHTTAVDSVRLPLSAVHRLETRTASHRHTVSGLGVGALSGGLISGLLVASIAKDVGNQCQNQQDLSCVAAPITRAEVVPATLAGAAVGGLLGALIGSIIVTEDWTAADVKSTARIEIVPRAKGLGVRLAYSF